MAWAFVQKAVNAIEGDWSLTTTLSGTTAGNFLVVHTLIVQSPGTFSISGGGLTYTQRWAVTTGNSGTFLYHHYVPSLPGGNLSVLIDTNHVNFCNIWCSLAEFSGADSSPISGSTSTTDSDFSSSTATTGTITPPDSDVLYVAAMSNLTIGTVTENSGGEGFTLLHEIENTWTTSGSGSGSAVYKIMSGAAGTQRERWTTPGVAWAAGIAAYKPGAAAPPAPTAGMDDPRMLTHTQRPALGGILL